MTNDLLTFEDIFDPSVPDAKVELGALASALQLAQGMTLLFVRCDQSRQRRELIAALRERLPQLYIQQITFTEPITHLLDELRFRMEEPAPDAIFVVGLENSVSVLQQAGNIPFVANLNAARNSFPRYVPCPLVLWVPEYVLTAIMNGAPDFFSVRSGVYQFENVSDTPEILSALVVRGDALDIPEQNFPTKAEKVVPPSVEQLERLEHLHTLLHEAQYLPADRRDLKMEARLLNQIGNAYFNMWRYDEAEQAQQQSLVIYCELGDVHGQAETLNYLGRIYRHQGLLSNSEEAHRRSLALSRQINDSRREASSLNYMGRTLRYQNRLDEAEDAHRSSLVLYRERNDYNDIARTLNYLGRTLRQHQRLDEAEAQHKEALEIWRRVRNRDDEAKTLNYLGIVHRYQQRYSEAEDAYRESLRIKREIDDLPGQATVLENLATLRAVQGDIYGALDFANQLLLVRQQIGNPYATQRTLRQIEQLRQDQQE